LSYGLRGLLEKLFLSWRSYSFLGEALGIGLHPGAVLVLGPLIKHSLLSLPGSKMFCFVPSDFLGL
jgi:hypothetical protein